MKDSRRLSMYRRTPGIAALLAILALPASAFAAISGGTGFFVTSDSYFLTCFQVIDGAQSISLKTGDGSIFDAEVVAVDRSNNLAVLKANGTFSPLPIAGATRIRRGTAVLTVVFRKRDIEGLESRLTRGVISNLQGASDDPAAFRITVSVPPGHCGAPLVTLDGNVVGMVTKKQETFEASGAPGERPQRFNYAVKSTHVLTLLNSIPEIGNKPAKSSRKQFADMSGLELIVEGAIAVVSVDTDRRIEEEQARERDQAERLRRARREQEARRTEAARRLEAEHIRQREINRLRTTVINFEQRESSLHHELMSIQQHLGSVSRDPADHSAMARRGELERQLNYLQIQLNQATTSKQGAMNQLNQQQVR